jgi:hypothetical protein
MNTFAELIKLLSSYYYFHILSHMQNNERVTHCINISWTALFLDDNRQTFIIMKKHYIIIVKFSYFFQFEGQIFKASYQTSTTGKDSKQNIEMEDKY